MLPTLLSPFTALMPVNGTYDVLSVPLLLPKDIVASLLPKPARTKDVLLEVPDALTQALGLKPSSGTNRLVLIQLGRQVGTGPGPLSLHFQEAKIEIPYVKHPECPDSSKVFSYKQRCIFDSKILSTGSSVQAGLASTTTTFSPVDSPSCFEPSAPTVSYSAQAYVDCEATLKKAKDTSDGGRITKTLSELPWYGDNTPRYTATYFAFAEGQVDTYDVRLKIHLASLTTGPSQGDRDVLEKEGVAYRTKSTFTSHWMDVRKV